ncbi:MAG: DNA polymerase III subunit beta [Chloroflexi bacterium]|nr:DNA polymerase III subunit beta [Chloroflexota bacterium]
MNLTCLQENLNRGLNLVSRAVAARSPLPVLSNVLLATEDGGLKLEAMNREMSISVWTGASIQAEGAITVPARLLSDFIGQLPEGVVALELDAETDTLEVSSGRFRAKMKGIGADEFPPIPVGDAERELEMPTSVWTSIIEQVVVAAAQDDSRPVLAGVSLTFGPDYVELAAADGYRLAVRRAAAETGLSEPTQIIVPRPAMVELSRILTDDPGSVTIGLTANAQSVRFSTRAVTLVSQLIDGQFPAYQQLIPDTANMETRVVADTAAVTQATRIAALFARDGQNVIRASIEGSDDGGRLVLSANSAELGENQGEVEAEVTGASTSAQIAFNYRFLSDCLGTVSSERVSLALAGPTSPGLVRQVDKDGQDMPSFSHVIMPMHTVS